MNVAREWWRPVVAARPVVPSSTVQPVVASSPVAFGALIVFTVMMLLAPQNFVPGLGTLRPVLLVALLALLAYVFDRVGRGRPLTVVTPEIVLSACLLGWAILTVPLSLWPGGSVDTIQNFLKVVLTFWLLSNVVTSVSRLRRVAWTLSLISLPLALTGVTQYVTRTVVGAGPNAAGRILGYEAGLTANANDLALMLNLLLPLSVALFLTERSVFRQFVLLGAMGCSVAAIVVTFSRAGFLTLALIGLMYLWRFRGRPERWWVYAALLCAVVATPWLLHSYLGRISTIVDIDADPTGSAMGRWQASIEALRYIAKHPIVGAGIGNDVLALRGANWHNIHNVYLQYGADLGLPGLALFLCILFGSLRRLWRLQRAAGRGSRDQLFYFSEGLEVSLWAFTIAAAFYPVAYYVYFYYLAGLGVGLSTGLEQRRRSAMAAEPAAA